MSCKITHKSCTRALIYKCETFQHSHSPAVNSWTLASSSTSLEAPKIIYTQYKHIYKILQYTVTTQMLAMNTSAEHEPNLNLLVTPSVTDYHIKILLQVPLSQTFFTCVHNCKSFHLPSRSFMQITTSYSHVSH